MKGIKSLVHQIRTGAVVLDEKTARDLIQQLRTDSTSPAQSETTLLQGLDQLAPRGSANGRELLKRFVEGEAPQGLSGNRQTLSTPWDLMWNNFTLFHPFFQVPVAPYASSQRASQNASQPALHEERLHQLAAHRGVSPQAPESSQIQTSPPGREYSDFVNSQRTLANPAQDPLLELESVLSTSPDHE